MNKFFFLLLLITLIYSLIILSWDVILGIAYTAPFSSWSYGAYLASVLPLLMVTLLFFITFMYSRQENQVKQLIFTKFGVRYSEKTTKIFWVFQNLGDNIHRHCWLDPQSHEIGEYMGFWVKPWDDVYPQI